MADRKRRRTRARTVAAGVALAGALLAAGCSGDDAATSSSTTPARTTPPPTSAATVAPSTPATTPPTSPPITTAVEATAPRDPGDEWARRDPSAAGFDPGALAELAATAEAAGSACTVVVRDGAVVDERYWDGNDATTTHPAWSITKSVTSVLTGIAQDHGDLSVLDQASSYIPEWQGTPSATVTIEQLLSNDSGRHWDLDTDYRQMAVAAPDKTEFAIGLAQDAAPGTVWAYNNAAVQTLSAVLQAATGTPVHQYADEVLFGRIGMSHTTLTTDRAGNTMTFAGMETTCLDLARLGQLMLNDGAWNGEQIVSPGYVRQSTRQSSTDLNAAYGWLWWTNQPGPIVPPTIATSATESAPVADGQLLPGAPADIFWAVGFQQQIVTVIPSEGIVAVRMGPKPPGDVTLSPADFARAVLGAIDEEHTGAAHSDG